MPPEVTTRRGTKPYFASYRQDSSNETLRVRGEKVQRGCTVLQLAKGPAGTVICESAVFYCHSQDGKGLELTHLKGNLGARPLYKPLKNVYQQSSQS